jgi:hypothetical protein
MMTSSAAEAKLLNIKIPTTITINIHTCHDFIIGLLRDRDSTGM